MPGVSKETQACISAIVKRIDFAPVPAILTPPLHFPTQYLFLPRPPKPTQGTQMPSPPGEAD